MVKPNEDYDVVIVGAGLVGATLALAITQSLPALSIVLVDAGERPDVPMPTEPPHFDPRVVALTPASIQWLNALGVWPDVRQAACDYQHMTVWDNEGTASIEFDAQELQQPALGAIIENRVLLSAVLSQLDHCSRVTVIRHQTVVATDCVKQIRHVTLADGRVLAAPLVVAADGAQSALRTLVDMPVRSWSYDHQAIVTTVKTERPHQLTAWQNFLATGPLAFLPLAHESQRYCSIVWSLETEQAAEIMTLNDPAFTQALAGAFEHRLGDVLHVDKRFSFPLVQRHAVDYIAPQLALVGDAAHTVHPLAGQGVNMGLQDAMSLTREVMRACQRELPLSEASILRRYQRQRKRHNMEMMLLMESFKRLFGSRQLALRWLRNVGMRQINHVLPIKNWLARQAMGL